MAWSETYTSEVKIEAEISFALTSTSTPTNAQVQTMAQEVEAEIAQLHLGNHTATDAVIDVPERLEDATPPVGTIAWFEAIAEPYPTERTLKVGTFIIPPFVPIISITSLSRRTSALGSTASWESLTEGYGDNSTDSFITLKRKTHSGKLLGYAIYFYKNLPTPGFHRVKMTYQYGMDIPTEMLSQYATWLTCLRVLLALSGSNNPVSITQFTGGGLQQFVTSIYAGRFNKILAKVQKFEDMWFHKPPAVGVL